MRQIADAHTHIYPDGMARRALEQIATFYGLEERLDGDRNNGTVGYLLETDRRCGISCSLACEAAHRPALVATLNTFVTDACRQSQGRLLGLAAIHPGCEDIEGILSRAKESGLRGVKIHPDYQVFEMDDPACDPIYRFCEREDFPVLIHCGDDRYDYSAPSRLQNVLDRFERLPVIAAHFGGFRRWEEAYRLRPAERLYFDTSSTLFALPREKALAFFDKFGTQRFLFGSDYPLFDPGEELERFLGLGLPQEDNSRILYGNFARLFMSGQS